MGYVTLKPFKAQLGTERVLTSLMPGDQVPGAEKWKVTPKLVQKGIIAFVGGGGKPAPSAPSLRLATVSATEDDDHEDVSDDEDTEETSPGKAKTKKPKNKSKR